MSLSFNSVTIAGTLGRDPEIKYTPSGKAVCQFSLAINSVFTKNGEKHETTTWIDFEAWEKTAETISKWCKKGHCILIEGRLAVDQWEDKETQKKRSKVKVMVERMHFVSKPKNEDSDDQEEHQERPPARPAARPPASRPPAQPPADPDDTASADDIPF